MRYRYKGLSQLFVFDLFYKPFQIRQWTCFISMALVIVIKQLPELFHYALGVECVVGTVSVGERSEICCGMTNCRCTD